jgi:hypothetical protein
MRCIQERWAKVLMKHNHLVAGKGWVYLRFYSSKIVVGLGIQSRVPFHQDPEFWSTKRVLNVGCDAREDSCLLQLLWAEQSNDCYAGHLSAMRRTTCVCGCVCVCVCLCTRRCVCVCVCTGACVCTSMVCVFVFMCTHSHVQGKIFRIIARNAVMTTPTTSATGKGIGALAKLFSRKELAFSGVKMKLHKPQMACTCYVAPSFLLPLSQPSTNQPKECCPHASAAAYVKA